MIKRGCCTRPNKKDQSYLAKRLYNSGLLLYRCEECSDCPYRSVCCKAKDENRRKEISVCWEFQKMRQKSYQNITTEEGKLLRCNRSIQAEGAFGQLKHNRSFKRFLTGGNIKVLAELLFLGLSQNIAHFQVQQPRVLLRNS